MTERTKNIIIKNNFLDMYAILKEITKNSNEVWGSEYYVLQFSEFSQQQIDIISENLLLMREMEIEGIVL